ncbi:MAG: hypothetical protein R3F41_14235 [Gammaproteobacteria bacterium]|nr:PD40 domain-containing protein [Pseudomonadales bacterium]
MSSFFQELKRRRVFRVAAVYAVVAWLLIQVADTVLPALQLPDWTLTFVTVIFILGFPIALILGWAYEITPEGIRVDNGNLTQLNENKVNQHYTNILLGLVLLAVGFLIVDRTLIQTPSQQLAQSTESVSEPGAMPAQSRRFTLNLGTVMRRNGSNMRADVALSADGRRLAFALERPGAGQQIYVLELNQLQPRLISSAEGDHPEFSPDGQWLIFNSDNEGVYKVALGGGAAQRLTDSVFPGTTGHWTSEDTVFYTTGLEDGTRLMQISAAGGEAYPVEFTGDPSVFSYELPYLLPNEDSLLLTAIPTSTGNARDGRIVLLQLSTGNITTLVQGGYNARYVPTGHIVFIRDAALWAVPFDSEQQRVIGREVPVVQGIETQGVRGLATYSFSNDGLLVYLPGNDTLLAQERTASLVWVDRAGNEEYLPQQRNFARPRVSQDGQKLAVDITEDGNGDTWIYDLTRNSLSRLSFSEFADGYPTWSPDGLQIAFASQREGKGTLWLRAANGTGEAMPLATGLSDASDAFPSSFSPDGGQLVFRYAEDIYLMTLVNYEVDQVRPLIKSEFREGSGQISADGRWIAYHSDETGRMEVYVRPFPNVDAGKYQISSEGGYWPRWSRDGNELFFRGIVGLTEEQTQQSVWSVEIESSGETFDFQIPRLLFQGDFRESGLYGVNPGFDVSPDASRFLLLKNSEAMNRVSEQTQLVVVENWFEELERLAPPDLQ